MKQINLVILSNQHIPEENCNDLTFSCDVLALFYSLRFNHQKLTVKVHNLVPATYSVPTGVRFESDLRLAINPLLISTELSLGRVQSP